MTNSEFKKQIFRTQAQWQSGLLVGAQLQAAGGITLFSRPVFDDWLDLPGVNAEIASLFVDACSQVFYLDPQSCHLFSYDPASGVREKIPYLSGCGPAIDEVLLPGRLLMDRCAFFITDTGNACVKAISRETGQLIFVIDDMRAPLDIALSPKRFLYVLDCARHEIRQYERSGRLLQTFGRRILVAPMQIAVGKANKIYVIDRRYDGFLRFEQNGEYDARVGAAFRSPEGFLRTLLTISPSGNLFVAHQGEESARLHEFDAEGVHLGEIKLPKNVRSISAIAFDAAGKLYLATDRGVARFRADKFFSGQPGYYYSKTLDNGSREDNLLWHRLDVRAEVPEKTSVELFYASSGDAQLQQTIDGILAGDDDVLKKQADIDSALARHWIGPEPITAGMLFRERTQRFLWLKLALTSFDQDRRPAVSEMQVVYPRLSYLRYLPPFYQEDPVSKDFLERFLALFETVFSGLEEQIIALFKHFDPALAPADFLEWLAGWLNVALEENWPEERKRRLIAEAMQLYKQKGTPAGLVRFLEIIAGISARVVENARVARPFILLAADKALRLGLQTVVKKASSSGFLLGYDPILGRTMLQSTPAALEQHFLPNAYFFTVYLDLSEQAFRRQEKALRQAIEAFSPAHTRYTIRLIGEGRTGKNIFLGVNTRLRSYPPFRIDVSSKIGGAVAGSAAPCCPERQVPRLDGSAKLR